MTWVIRLLVFVATAYLAILVILWVFQSRFIYPAPQTVAPLTPGYQEVQLQTSDGLSLRAFYRGASDGLPTVVYFHGNGGTLRGSSVSNGAIVDAGIGALLVGYRGYGGNPGQPSEAGFYRDGEAAMAWLADRGVSRDRTVIIGNSIGGGVASELAIRHDPAALILVSPFTSLPDAAGDNLWWLPARSLVREQFNNRAKVERLGIPVLVQHGTADTLISDSHGEALAEAAADSEFQTFAGSGHALSFEPGSQTARRDWILSLGLGAAP